MQDLGNTSASGPSFSGRNWNFPQVDAAAVAALRARGIGEHVAVLMAARGITPEEAADFLDPKIKNLMPDPYVLLDMEKGATRIAKAITEKERIGIWSDYDADGANSAAVLGWFLRMVGHDDFVLRIPDRIKEGYGPNGPGLLEMKRDEGCNLICVLDAGIVAFKPLIEAHEAGMEIVVVDHHMPADATPVETVTEGGHQVTKVIPHQNPDHPIPVAHAVINPNRADQAPGYGHLCAGGVTFLFAIAVCRLLRNQGYFDGKEGRPGEVPSLMRLLDFVAMATVCDVVPLTTLNRAFVRTGLQILSKRSWPGIAELARAAGIEEGDLTETHCGWQLGPRINAGGRIGASDSGALLLLEADPGRAKLMADELDALNVTRREIEAKSTEKAIEQMAGRVAGGDRTLALAVVEDAHEGIVGISAGRLKERFDAPAIVLAEDHEGNLKGSARSVPGFDIGHAIIAAAREGLIIRGGGHGMAGGLTLRRDQLEGFLTFMNAEIAKSNYYKTGVQTQVDLALPLSGITVKMIESLDVMRPFGTANPEPVVMAKGVTLNDIRVLKEKHFKLTLTDGKESIDALIWNIVGSDLAAAIEAARGETVDIIGTVSVNEFRGKKKPQMMLQDLRLATAPEMHCEKAEGEQDPDGASSGAIGYAAINLNLASIAIL